MNSRHSCRVRASCVSCTAVGTGPLPSPSMLAGTFLPDICLSSSPCIQPSSSSGKPVMADPPQRGSAGFLSPPQPSVGLVCVSLPVTTPQHYAPSIPFVCPVFTPLEYRFHEGGDFTTWSLEQSSEFRTGTQ